MPVALLKTPEKKNSGSDVSTRTLRCAAGAAVERLRQLIGARRGKVVSEPLESRVFLSSVSWTGTGDGVNWTDPRNWSGHVVPVVTDDVTINASSNSTIQVASGVQTIHSLTSYDSLLLTNATLSITASSSISGALSIRSGGILSCLSIDSSGLVMSVTGNVTISAGGQITTNGLGYGSAQGLGTGTIRTNNGGTSGGGGYGGDGANDNAGDGGTYGSVTQPTDLGSGGGPETGSGGAGGSGGGAIHLTVGGTLEVDGTISSDGANGTSGGGGGSGGSVWITAGTIAGAGQITATGGQGGGGGRIAIGYSSNQFTGKVQTYGTAFSSTSLYGGAGTVYMAPITGTATVTIDNGGNIGAMTGFPNPTTLTANVVVQNGGVVGPATGTGTLNLSVSGNVTVGATGQISSNGLGYISAQGLGTGTTRTNNGGTSGGGGYGGDGANDNSGDGGTYGSVTQPTDLGSGGGSEIGSGGAGGFGGGAIRLTVGGTLEVDGTVSSNGANGTSGGGGGSGGSVWITAGTVSGAGQITASGGQGGGGGRIAIGYSSNQFTRRVQALGTSFSSVSLYGGAGTVYMSPATGMGTVIIDNGGNSGAATGLANPTTFVANLLIQNGAIVGPATATSTLNLTVSGNTTVASGGQITATALGYGSGQGPGTGTIRNTGTSGGGGYGGTGGSENTGDGQTYGSSSQPTDLGSGGGPETSSSGGVGGAGGGAIRLVVGGTLEVDGSISSNGANGVNGGGGGSGGSIWISAETAAGAGQITATGGQGGGGGRIAVYYGADPMSGGVTASAGGGSTPGSPGTVYKNQYTMTLAALTNGQLSVNAISALGPIIETLVSGQYVFQDFRIVNSFPSSLVHSISFNGTASDDLLTLNGVTAAPLTFAGGAGDDGIDTSAGASVPLLTVSGGNVTFNGSPLTNSSLQVNSSATVSLDEGFTVTNLLSNSLNSVLEVSENLTGTSILAGASQFEGAVIFDGSGTAAAPQLLEAMSADEGSISSGFVQNFVYNNLQIANGTYVNLVDLSHNSAFPGSDAVYANALTVAEGTTLNLNGLHLYARLASIEGTVIGGSVTIGQPAGVLQLGVPNSGTINSVGQSNQ